MSKGNGQSNSNKEVMNIKIPVCIALSVDNKCRDPLTIKTEITIK